jgi:aryl-alcohol dehydrogenase-like predicted oxidoreductase
LCCGVGVCVPQGGDVVPIPGTTKVKNLLSNVEAQTVALTSDECAMVASAIDLDKVSGDRFTAAGQTFKANL